MDFAPYESSRLTHVLSDGLGGNAKQLCLACLRQGSYVGNVATMNLAKLLSRVQSYPVLNDENVQGLIRRLRLKIRSLYDEIGRVGGITDAAGADRARQALLRVQELEGRVIGHDLQKIKLIGDKDRVYEKLVEFRARYNDLVDSKAQLQSNLIESESEKLSFSKALLDLQMENTQLHDDMEKEKFELVSKLMNAENDILQLEMKQQQRNSAVAELGMYVCNIIVTFRMRVIYRVKATNFHP